MTTVMNNIKKFYYFTSSSTYFGPLRQVIEYSAYPIMQLQISKYDNIRHQICLLPKNLSEKIHVIEFDNPREAIEEFDKNIEQIYGKKLLSPPTKCE